MGSRGTQRTERVGQQLHEMISSMLLFDVADPRLKNVQITGVDVATDLKTADVFYVMIDENSPEPEKGVQKALEGSSGFLRKMLGEQLRMKFVPELRFKYDESIERGRRIEALLDEIRPDSEE